MVQGVDGDFGGVQCWDFDLVSKEIVCVFVSGLGLALGTVGISRWSTATSFCWLWLEEDEGVND